MCQDITVQCAIVTAIFLIHYLVIGKKTVFKEKEVVRFKTTAEERCLKSSCVTIPSRVSLMETNGLVDPKFKFRDIDWDIKGMNADQAMDKLHCKAEGKILATQIGPLLHGSEKRTPTVKHSCKRCVMAAAIRATSNKISPDPVDLKNWKEFFLNDAREARQKIFDIGGLKFSIDEWAKHYPEKYREEIYRTMQKPTLFEQNFGKYDSFPKIELQFTTVPHDLKDTPLNDVKERQISAPQMDKKIAGGVGTYALEGLFHGCGAFPWYCGRQNWEDICTQLDEKLIHFDDYIAGAADMSGLDMTLGKEVCETQTEAIGIIIEDNPAIEWDMNLSPELMLRAYRESEGLTVSVDRGSVQYTTVGRASGDSWTTFSNTWIVGSMFRFALMSFGFNPRADGVRAGWKPFLLKCKGDDTLFFVEKRDHEAAKMAIARFFALKNEYVKHGLGTVVKFVKWGRIDEMDFLSNQFFLRADGTLRMTRIPCRVFQTLGFSTKNVDPNDLVGQRELCYSKGMCLLAWAKGLPIFEKLALKFIELGNKNYKVDKEWEYVDKYRVWNKAGEDRNSFLQWLWTQYGVSAEEVEQLENIIDELEIHDQVSLPVIEKFYV